MKTSRRLFTLSLFLIPVLTFASDSIDCEDLKYIGANKLSILVGIQDTNPAYRACLSTTKFAQAFGDLDAEYPAKAMSDDSFRAQSSELRENREELGYQEAVRYSNVTARAFERSGRTEEQVSGLGLSFGSLSKPISTAPGYKTISGSE